MSASGSKCQEGQLFLKFPGQYRTQADKSDELILIYDSPRKLCPVLMGAIEGAAERYGEQVQIVEQTCMNRGDLACRFAIRFSASATGYRETPEQREHEHTKQQFARFILSILPDEEGWTLTEVQKHVVLQGVRKEWARPALLLEALPTFITLAWLPRPRTMQGIFSSIVATGEYRRRVRHRALQ